MARQLSSFGLREDTMGYHDAITESQAYTYAAYCTSLRCLIRAGKDPSIAGRALKITRELATDRTARGKTFCPDCDSVLVWERRRKVVRGAV